MKSRLGWLEWAGTIAFSLIAIWWIGYLAKNCQATAACEASGRIETANCHWYSGDKVVCDWKCVAPPVERPPVDTLNEQMHEIEEKARAYRQQLEADDLRRWNRIHWPTDRWPLHVADQDFDAEHWSDL